MLAFTAARLLTPPAADDHPLLLVDQGLILEISPRSSRQLPANTALLDFGDSIIAPGYVDLHIHGSAGYDVMDDTADALPAIENFLARHGVTTYFPTTVTAPMDTTLRALERLANAIEKRERTKRERNNKDDSGLSRSESTSKARSLATLVAALIPRKTCWLPRWPGSISSGRPRADALAS